MSIYHTYRLVAANAEVIAIILLFFTTWFGAGCLALLFFRYGPNPSDDDCD